MSFKSKNTAYLIFIRDPEVEAAHKVFAEHIGKQGNQKIAKALNQRIRNICKSTQTPTFIFNSARQIGNSFGERLGNAFETVFKKGFTNVIAVGNDCLSLSKKKLIEAELSLSKHRMALGPTPDGGLYLIGLSQQAYNRKWFLNFDWTTDRIQQDFLDFAQRFNLCYKLFEKASDFNAGDLKTVLSSLSPFDHFSRLLKNLFQRLYQAFAAPETVLIFQIHLQYTALRAPPQQKSFL